MNALADIAAGVLVAGLFLGGAGLGAAVLRLIGRLAGGTWSEAQLLQSLAGLAPMLLILAFAARIALAFMLPGAGYMASGWAAFRLFIACTLWVGVSWIGKGSPSQAVSAGALVAFGASLPLMGFDLIDSLEPGWVSSAEAYALGVRMMGAALATVLLLAPPQGRDQRDLQGLLIATLLATLYLNLMSYLVPWYGNLPGKTGWIRLRDTLPWKMLIVTALALGAALPLPLLALQKRLGEGASRIAAGLALFGLFAQTVWLIAPAFSVLALFGAVGFSGIGATAVWTRTYALRKLVHG